VEPLFDNVFDEMPTFEDVDLDFGSETTLFGDATLTAPDELVAIACDDGDEADDEEDEE